MATGSKGREDRCAGGRAPFLCSRALTGPGRRTALPRLWPLSPAWSSWRLPQRPLRVAAASHKTHHSLLSPHLHLLRRRLPSQSSRARSWARLAFSCKWQGLYPRWQISCGPAETLKPSDQLAGQESHEEGDFLRWPHRRGFDVWLDLSPQQALLSVFLK